MCMDEQVCARLKSKGHLTTESIATGPESPLLKQKLAYCISVEASGEPKSSI